MSSNHLKTFSRYMATTALWLIVLALALNTLTWIVPDLNSMEGRGFEFSMENTLSSALHFDISTSPWWQRVGAILLSNLPLLALAAGLWHLRALFLLYSHQEYFSIRGARHLKRVGQFVALWVIFGFLCQPLLSLWLTIIQPAGEHLISEEFSGSDAVSLFLAGSIAIIAKILEQASIIHQENQQFI